MCVIMSIWMRFIISVPEINCVINISVRQNCKRLKPASSVRLKQMTMEKIIVKRGLVNIQGLQLLMESDSIGKILDKRGLGNIHGLQLLM